MEINMLLNKWLAPSSIETVVPSKYFQLTYYNSNNQALSY